MKNSLIYNWGFSLLSIVVLTYALTALSFAIGLTVNAVIFPLAIVTALFISLKLNKANGWKSVITTPLIIVFVSLIISAFLWDNSYDGNTYHQASILYLADGWNPIYDACPAQNIWSAHYAKALEYAEASTFKFVAALGFNPIYSIESSKAINILLLAATILICVASAKRLIPNIDKRKAIIIALVIAANPVAMQVFTFYNDYTLYCEIAILLASFIGIAKRGEVADWIVAISVTILAIGTKFTHFFYAGVAWAAFFAYLIATKRFSVFRKSIITAVVTAIVGALVLGAHPYVTNTAKTGSPLYPIIGSGVDIMTTNTPSVYNDCDRFTNFIKSQFTSPEGESWSEFPVPLSRDAFLGVGYDSRSLGFGAFFIWILLASIVILIISKAKPASYFIVVCLILSAFIIEQAWWARYVAFLWIVPVVAIVASYINNEISNRSISILRAIVYVLIFANSAIPFAAQIAKDTATRQYETALFESLEKAEPVNVNLAGFESFAQKFNLLGIAFNEVSKNEIQDEKAVYLYGKSGLPKLPIAELKDDGFNDLTKRCESMWLVEFNRRLVKQK
ncbi:MAG: hypothetical protein IK120_02895 [Muribaculaceae bacterium]|nr:hypothetical protein [Muribaculaceae bacterium]